MSNVNAKILKFKIEWKHSENVLELNRDNKCYILTWVELILTFQML
jgi:hypothetical protein